MAWEEILPSKTELTIPWRAAASREESVTARRRVADEFAEIIVTRQNRYIARVTSAIALSQAQLERLGRTLNAVYGRELKLDVSVDPAVLGGLRVQVGDEVIDGTVETRMSDLARSIG